MPSTPAKKPPAYVVPERKSTGMIVVIAVAAVAVLALIAAIVISQVGGDDDGRSRGHRADPTGGGRG